jgi:multidrug efflux pump subunit AcrA (membrane-fusion protein)
MKKNKLIIIAAVAMLMIGVVIAFNVLPNVFQNKQVKQAASQQAPNDLGISTEVANVEASSLTKEINYIGTIEPKNSVVLSPKVTSQVFKVNVQEGDSVKKEILSVN